MFRILIGFWLGFELLACAAVAQTIRVGVDAPDVASALELAAATNAAEVYVPQRVSGSYVLTRTVQVRNWHGVMRGAGNGQHSTIHLATPGARLEFVGCKRLRIESLSFSTPKGATNAPAAAIVVARANSGESANGFVLRDVQAIGWFRVAPVVNVSCELARYESSQLANHYPGAAALVIANDDWWGLGYSVFAGNPAAGAFTSSGHSLDDMTLTVYGPGAACLQLSGETLDVRGDFYGSAQVAGQVKVRLDCRPPPTRRGGTPRDVDLRVWEEGKSSLVEVRQADGATPPGSAVRVWGSYGWRTWPQ